MSKIVYRGYDIEIDEVIGPVMVEDEKSSYEIQGSNPGLVYFAVSQFGRSFASTADGARRGAESMIDNSFFPTTFSKIF